MPERELDIARLRKFGRKAIENTVIFAAEYAELDPRMAFEPRPHSSTEKFALRVDLAAEDVFFGYIRKCGRGRFASIERFAEETERGTAPPNGLSVMVDAVDGTDLMERGLGNWCSAALFFDPTRERGHRIIAAFVGFSACLPKRPPQICTKVYYASDDRDGVWTHDGKTERAANGLSSVTSLSHTSLCFYGQKVSRLTAFAGGPLPHQIGLEGKAMAGFRVYSFGGNPMMAKMMDQPFPGARWIDAVIEITGDGQLAHDVVPGAYIALRGGATMKDPTGKPVTIETLEDSLMVGGKRLKYIAAATPELCDAIVAWGKWTDPVHPGRRHGDRRPDSSRERRRHSDSPLEVN